MLRVAEMRTSDGPNAVRSSIDRAARFLVDMQAKSGAWADFDAGFGFDAWTTAYVAVCLLAIEAEVATRERRYVRIALEQAAPYVQSWRRPDGTWGCRALPSDSDSTAWCSWFLDAMGRPPHDATFQALLTFARTDGGFATFNAGPDGKASTWCDSHPDVTPVVTWALAKLSANFVIRPQTIDFIVGQRSPDGLWNSYWYRTPLYATLHNLAALKRDGRTVTRPTVALLKRLTATGDPFELAHALEIATTFIGDDAEAGDDADTFVRDSVTTLLASQSAEGWWTAQPLMRVTDHGVSRPWELPGDAGGPFYRDDYFLFTTATVARALSCVARTRRFWREDGDGQLP